VIVRFIVFSVYVSSGNSTAVFKVLRNLENEFTAVAESVAVHCSWIPNVANE
jgi:hypothetical protein